MAWSATSLTQTCARSAKEAGKPQQTMGVAMATDRELLELAAKAAGFTPIHWHIYAYEVRDDATGGEFIWNPLTDDGQALRLAVKLRRFPSTTQDNLSVFCGYESVKAGKRSYHSPIIEPFGEDPAAATRRAIVRAAAAIGRAITATKENTHE